MSEVAPIDFPYRYNFSPVRGSADMTVYAGVAETSVIEGLVEIAEIALS